MLLMSKILHHLPQMLSFRLRRQPRHEIHITQVQHKGPAPHTLTTAVLTVFHLQDRATLLNRTLSVSPPFPCLPSHANLSICRQEMTPALIPSATSKKPS